MRIKEYLYQAECLRQVVHYGPVTVVGEGRQALPAAEARRFRKHNVGGIGSNIGGWLALSATLGQGQPNKEGYTLVFLDFKPDFPVVQLRNRSDVFLSLMLSGVSLNVTQLKALFLRLLRFNGTCTIRFSSANWLSGRIYWVVRGRRIRDARCARPVRCRVARVTLTGFAGRAH